MGQNHVETGSYRFNTQLSLGMLERCLAWEVYDVSEEEVVSNDLKFMRTNPDVGLLPESTNGHQGYQEERQHSYKISHQPGLC